MCILHTLKLNLYGCRYINHSEKQSTNANLFVVLYGKISFWCTKLGAFLGHNGEVNLCIPLHIPVLCVWNHWCSSRKKLWKVASFWLQSNYLILMKPLLYLKGETAGVNLFVALHYDVLFLWDCCCTYRNKFSNFLLFMPS